jgi:hypothetical protein
MSVDRSKPGHPRVRKLILCPCCGEHKQTGLLVCWPCNRHLKERYNGTYGPFEFNLNLCEDLLTSAEAQRLVSA